MKNKRLLAFLLLASLSFSGGAESTASVVYADVIQDEDPVLNRDIKENITTAEDGSVTTTTSFVNEDGSKVETTRTVNKDGSSVDVKVETSATGVVVKTVNTIKADGSGVKVVELKKLNSFCKEVDIKTITRTNEFGKVISNVKNTTILNADNNIDVVVIDRKDKKSSKPYANVLATIKGKRLSLSGDVISQIKEAVYSMNNLKSANVAAGDNILLTLTARDSEGNIFYEVDTDTAALGTDSGLYLYKVAKSGKLVMANDLVYKVADDGSISASISKNGTYKLVTKSEAKKRNKKIRATFKAKKSHIKLKKGKKATFHFKKGALKDNVRKIRYSSSKKSVAKVSSSGKIKARKKGKATICAKILFKNGSRRTVKMVVRVKP